MESTLDIINLLHANKKADALEKIDDLLYKKAAEVIDNYKKVVASSYFDEPVDTEEQ